MYRQQESNPHFVPRRRDDPAIEFPPRAPRPRTRPPTHHQSHTSVEPPHGPRPQPPPQQPKPPPPYLVDAPHGVSRPHGSQPLGAHPAGVDQHPDQPAHRNQHPGAILGARPSHRTNPVTWLIAVFCVLFWVIVIVGGLIILIVYLVFRPRNPRFDISTATLNAAYLDMGYLLNADVTLLVNFTNPNTKVNLDFRSIGIDIYYEKSFIATRYIEPFTVTRRESRFADVHMLASQVRLSMGPSMALQRQIAGGRVNFEVKGFFKTRSRLGGIFQYSYWLHSRCQIVVAGPPTGALIGKKCVTRR